MCYCTRVFWPKVQPHCSCREQNAELSDCWRTVAVTGCCFLTHGWHRAPTVGPFEHHPELWCGRVTVAILTRFHFRLALPASYQEAKEAWRDQFTLMWVGVIMAPFNPLIQDWPLQTWRRSAVQQTGILLWRLTGGDVGVSRQVWERCRRGSGDFSFFPIQGQTACVRHSPSGSVSVCRRNFNLADRRHAGTVRSFFPSLCSHLHSHLILSDYDSWSFAFKHKSTPLSLTSLKITDNHGKASYGNILLKRRNLMAVIKDLF